METNRVEYSIEDYDFYADEQFQEFFHNQLPNHKITPNRFIRILIRCKEEWIKQLNAKIHKQIQIELQKEREEYFKRIAQIEPYYD